MIKLIKKTVTTKGIKVDFKVRKNSWMGGLLKSLLDADNQEMLKRYLCVSCKEMTPYIIFNEDMLNVTSTELNHYTTYIRKYKKKTSI